MEVILREDIDKLGSRGQVVKVASGYARNYLLPKKLAVAATDSNKKIVEQERQSYLRKEAKDVAEALEAKNFTIDRRKIQLEEPIRTLGEHKVAVRLHREVSTEVTVNVVRAGE
jgi:large subunit ribosomal protein L9